MIKVDPGTFGGSKAARTLAEILPDRRAVGKVKAFLQHYELVLVALNSIESTRYRKYLLNLVRADTICRARELPYEPRVLSFIRNVVKARARVRVLHPMDTKIPLRLRSAT